MKNADGRNLYLRRFYIARKCEIHLMWNLRGQFVEIQRGDETEHRPWHAQTEVHKVGVSQRIGFAQAVNPLCLADKFACFHHFVQNVFGYAQFNGGGCAQDAAVV